jgi:hypothetical protein
LNHISSATSRRLIQVRTLNITQLQLTRLDNMGSNQSRPADEQEKAALEGLGALQLEKKAGFEEGYVLVHSEKDTKHARAVLDSRTPESVPVSRMAEW